MTETTIERKAPMRVLQVLGTTNLGGAESRVMDSYRHMDREKIQFDFVVHTDKKGYYDEEIAHLGGRIYRMPRFRMFNLIEYRKAWKNFFNEHPGYQAVHGHMTSTASIYLPIAKRAGVPLTLAHARSAGVDPGLKGRLTRFLRRNLGRQADACLTCSALAGEAVFGKAMMEAGKVYAIPNAIDAAAFAFSEERREKLRGELGFTPDNFVLGHVGRFDGMKNHLFLVEIFALVEKQLPQARLLLVGQGGLMDAVRDKAKELGVGDKVILIGNRSDVADCNMAMDYFVFPSLFEGLPGSVVEAQATGLRCLISDTVTEEVLITPLATAMSLKAGAAAWAEEILKHRDYPREQMTEAIKAAGFDIWDQVRMLEELYEEKTAAHLPHAASGRI